MRLSAGLDGFVSMLAVALLAVAVALTLHKVVPGFSARHFVDVLVAAAIAVAGGTIYAATRPLPRLAGAMVLDAHHRLADRLTSALSFAALPAEERTPLMQVAIDDACQRAGKLSPRRAVRLGWPRDLAAAFVFLGGVILLAVLHPRAPRPLAQAKMIDPVVLSADDIDLFREVGKKLAENDKNPEVLAALKEYNQLVEDLAQKRIDRTEAFRKLAALESRLSQGDNEAKALEEQLKMRATALKKSELSRPLAEALEKQDLPRAEEKMRDLAQRLRDKPDSVAKDELERLRQAMKAAAEGQKERLAALEQRREELQQELLRQKAERDGGLSEEERSLFDKKERELERLDRERETAARDGRKLDRLDRDLEKAAEDILRELGMSADDLEQAAEDINRMEQEKMSQEEREELRQRLEDLREQLRQAGQGGQQRMARLRRFIRQAHGGGQPGKNEACPPGDPNCQEGQGQESEGEDGQGQGQGHKSEPIIVIGPGGQRISVTRGRSGGEEGQQGQEGRGEQGSDPKQPGGEGHEKGNDLYGHGHDPKLVGKPTDPRMGTMDVHAAGLDTGQGPSRGEVILGAAEKGFRGGPYKRVYTEYRTSAEEQLHEDKIPPGGSEHIRRYFDLIRPRE